MAIKKRKRNLFSLNKPSWLVFFGMLVIALFLFVVDATTTALKSLHYGLEYAVEPIRSLSATPQRAISSMDEWVVSYKKLQDNNEQLRAENEQLNVRMLKMESLKNENNQLRQALSSSEQLGNNLYLAEVLEVKMSNRWQEIIVNKGGRDEVYVDQPVLSSQGLVGQVMEVWPSQSKILLITDENSEIPVKIDRNGIRGILKGSGNVGRVELLYIPIAADVRIGDVVTTSGLGSRFPRGYPVGKVVHVDRGLSAAFAEIEIEPSSALNQILHVLLIDKLKGNSQQ